MAHAVEPTWQLRHLRIERCRLSRLACESLQADDRARRELQAAVRVANAAAEDEGALQRRSKQRTKEAARKHLSGESGGGKALSDQAEVESSLRGEENTNQQKSSGFVSGEVECGEWSE